MTHKDHGELAGIFHQHLRNANCIELPITADNDHPHSLLSALVDDIADYCERDNPRFDRDRFMIGTGIGIV